jgi:hypothetical protein
MESTIPEYQDGLGKATKYLNRYSRLPARKRTRNIPISRNEWFNRYMCNLLPGLTEK